MAPDHNHPDEMDGSATLGGQLTNRPAKPQTAPVLLWRTENRWAENDKSVETAAKSKLGSLESTKSVISSSREPKLDKVLDRGVLSNSIKSLLNVSWLETDPVWLQIAIVGVCLGVIVLLAESLHRYKSIDPEKVRKVVHLGTGNVILLAWWLEMPAWVGITASILASAVTLLSYKFPILPGINSVGRQSLGTFFYAVSIGLLIAWFWPLHQPQYAVMGVLVMTWGDGLAALVGQRFGKHTYKVWGIQKSWEGSLTMSLVSYIVCSLIFLGVQGNVWQTWVMPIAVALVATGLEAFSKFGIDNLTVPLGSAALGFVLTQILI